jgi:hypothetical protein
MNVVTLMIYIARILRTMVLRGGLQEISLKSKFKVTPFGLCCFEDPIMMPYALILINLAYRYMCREDS